MNTNINELKKIFNNIKEKDLNLSLRKGPSGLGYTFEKLIGKEEDNSYKPDFKGIEIKTKIGYSKTSYNLFCLTPKGIQYSTKYILNKYGYFDKENRKSFKTNVFMNYNRIISNKYIFRLGINYELKRLELKVYDIFKNKTEDIFYWEFSDIKERLYTKLKYLAVIKGYPYKRNNSIYYKYTNLYIYKLKDFNVFLQLITKGIIYITFNIGIYKSGKRSGTFQDHGTAFRIKKENIDDLFDLIEKC